HLPRAFVKVPRESVEGADERLGQRSRGWVLELTAQFSASLEGRPQCRGRFRDLASLPAHERDPEIAVGEQATVRRLAGGGGGASGVLRVRGLRQRPARPGSTDRGAQAQVDLPLVDNSPRFAEQRNGLPGREYLQRVIAGGQVVLGGAPAFSRLLVVHG